MRSASGGHPSHATATATPSSASRTASLVRNIRVGRPDSAAPTATRKATVTFSVSSSPVVRLTTALPGIGCLLLGMLDGLFGAQDSASGLGVVGGALELHEDGRFVAHRPGVMARSDAVHLARLDLTFGAV